MVSGLREADPTGYLIDITEVDVNKFDMNSNADIFAIVDDLVARSAALNVGERDQLSKATGVNLSPDGILLDMSLRPHLPEPLNRWDVMHCFYSHGVASTELVAFLAACKSHMGITYKDLELFCSAAWICPKFKHKLDAKVVFSAKRELYTHNDKTI